jgi:hypothetical protein
MYGLQNETERAWTQKWLYNTQLVTSRVKNTRQCNAFHVEVLNVPTNYVSSRKTCSFPDYLVNEKLFYKTKAYTLVLTYLKQHIKLSDNATKYVAYMA